MKKIAIIGGGAAGLVCAVMLSRLKKFQTVLYERNDRLGKKLSATGNGQGNVTNLDMGADHYFTDDKERVASLLAQFGEGQTVDFLQSLGGVFLADERGRVYPAGRQASAVTDLLRNEVGCEVRLSSKVASVKAQGDQFAVAADGREEEYDAVVVCTGGKAAPNFGSDGNGYAIAEAFGHTVTECSPALVRLTTAEDVRGLKGIRLDALVRSFRKEQLLYSVRGDVLFTENGVSGDAIFRTSSYVREGDRLEIDLLPDVPDGRLMQVLEKRKGEDCLWCVVSNGLGRALYRRANGDRRKLLGLIKRFPLTVRGTAGFSCAQVTKGGVPLGETDGRLMSKKKKNLFFAGEILNVDGECGGYNLQWAFTSAFAVVGGIRHAFDAE